MSNRKLWSQRNNPRLGLFIVLGLAFLPASISANELLVNSLADPGDGVCNAGTDADPGDCTLREAVATALDGDQISFDLSLNEESVVLASPLDVGGQVTIIGPKITVDGGDLPFPSTAINVTEPGSEVTLKGLTIRGRGVFTNQTAILDGVTVDVTDGSAVALTRSSPSGPPANLTINNSTIKGGRARIGAGILNNSSTVTVLNSTIVGNTAVDSGGPASGAGYYQSESYGTATGTFTNVTVSDNTATGSGGGIWVDGGTATLTNSTITNNHADSDAGGVAVNNTAPRVYLKNTIVLGNTAGSYTETNDCSGFVREKPMSLGYNLSGPSCPNDGPADIVATATDAPGPVADNGGPTFTHSLPPGNPAIDAADQTTCGSLLSDQRGAPRSVGVACDIGAFESGPPAINVDPALLDFGDLDVGTSSMMIVNVSNAGNETLTISDIALPAGPFSFASIATPVQLQFDETKDVYVTFSPTAAGPSEAAMTFTSDDPQQATAEVTLRGTGVAEETDPFATIQQILAFMEASRLDGTLSGEGPGNSAEKRFTALYNMIKAAGDLLAYDIDGACEQLLDARNRTDGEPKPPEFVQGPAATTLETSIQDLRTDMGCSG